MCEGSRVNIKVERFNFHILRATFNTLRLVYLRTYILPAYTRKQYGRGEIHP